MTTEGDELIRRYRTALAEFGYGDATLWEDGVGADGTPAIFSRRDEFPDAVWWQACYIVRRGHMACWSCWSPHSGSVEVSAACRMGDCAHPDGPHRPPREALVGR